MPILRPGNLTKIPPIQPRSLDRLQGFFTLDVVDPKGKYLGRGESKDADIFTDQFGGFMAGLLQVPVSGHPYITIKDNTGASRGVCVYSDGPTGSDQRAFNYTKTPAPANQALGALLSWGTNAGAVARTDTELGTIVGSPVAATSTTYTSAAGTLVVAGSATNGSGVSKTAAEAGAYGQWWDRYPGGVSTLCYFLLAHDLVSPTVTVPNGASVSITWTVQM